MQNDPKQLHFPLELCLKLRTYRKISPQHGDCRKCCQQSTDHCIQLITLHGRPAEYVAVCVMQRVERIPLQQLRPALHKDANQEQNIAMILEMQRTIGSGCRLSVTPQVGLTQNIVPMMEPILAQRGRRILAHIGVIQGVILVVSNRLN